MVDRQSCIVVRRVIQVITLQARHSSQRYFLKVTNVGQKEADEGEGEGPL